MESHSVTETARRAVIDIPALSPQLRLIARRLGRYFPEHLMDTDDFMQTGYLGTLRISEQAGETTEERIARQIRAGRREMIDALRGFRSPHSRKHQLEVLVADITHLADEKVDRYEDEHRRICAHDLQALVARLSLREQIILLARLRGVTMAELGEQLDLTEGRIWQIQARIIAEIQEAE